MHTATPADPAGDLALDWSGVTDARRWWVAFSGGLDSTVLLHAVTWQADRPVMAVHVHHGLDPAADAWSAHCQTVCRNLGVTCDVRHVTVDTRSGGVEAGARTARYTAFADVLDAGDVLLMAHHRDDQVETLLLRLARGAGPRGLAGMPQTRALGAGRLCRPLLGQPRSALRDYAHAHDLNWLEDPSNDDPALDRGYLRGHVLPALRSRWPGFDAAAARGAAHLADAAAALQRADAGWLAGDALRVGAVAQLAADDRPRAARLLRDHLRDRGLPTPSTAVVDQILSSACTDRPDAQPRVQWGGVEMRRYRDALWCMPNLTAPPGHWSQHWRGDAPLHLPGPSGRLTAESCSGSVDGWQVRFPQAGDVIAQDGRPRKGFGRWAQEAGIPPWVRLRMPLLVVDDVICAAGGIVIQSALAPAGLRWEHALVGAPASVTGGT